MSSIKTKKKRRKQQQMQYTQNIKWQLVCKTCFMRRFLPKTKAEILCGRIYINIYIYIYQQDI